MAMYDTVGRTSHQQVGCLLRSAGTRTAMKNGWSPPVTHPPYSTSGPRRRDFTQSKGGGVVVSKSRGIRVVSRTGAEAFNGPSPVPLNHPKSRYPKSCHLPAASRSPDSGHRIPLASSPSTSLCALQTPAKAIIPSIEIGRICLIARGAHTQTHISSRHIPRLDDLHCEKRPS